MAGSRTDRTLFSQAGAAGRMFQPRPLGQNTKPWVLWAVTAPGTLGSDSLTPEGQEDTHSSSHHTDQPRNPLGVLSRDKKGKQRAGLLYPGTALPPWHPGQGCWLSPALTGVTACPAHPRQLLEEGKKTAYPWSLSPAGRAGWAQHSPGSTEAQMQLKIAPRRLPAAHSVLYV